jgi:hypothetical protein
MKCYLIRPLQSFCVVSFVEALRYITIVYFKEPGHNVRGYCGLGTLKYKTGLKVLKIAITLIDLF